jgi:hypothetical protein
MDIRMDTVIKQFFAIPSPIFVILDSVCGTSVFAQIVLYLS